MKKDTDNWLKIAKYDLRAAQVSFDGEMYLTCVEKCHNAVEKLLKGIITEHGKIPSKIHNLLKLTSEALIDNLQDDIKSLFNKLNQIYTSTRYPDELDEIEELLSKPETEKILQATKEILKWLEKKIN
ncbi:MAG: HEPN domain-containing protein [Candidatus Melainabacteria bacterium]|nr:HEPN domain-containing protein [Candidatus Melainabacteria bacterium]